MKNSTLFSLSKALFCALLCATCVGAHAQGKSAITVCQIFDRTSVFGETARDYTAGAKSYFDSLNTRGGMDGRRISFLTFDIEAEQTRERVKELIEQERCEVFFGVVGDARVQAVASHPQVLAKRLPVFAPLTGLDRVEQNNNVLFTRATYAQEVTVAMEQLSRMGIKHIAAVFTNALPARAIGQTLTANQAKYGIKVDVLGFDGQDSSMPAVTKAISQLRPQAVFVLGDSIDVGRVAKAYRPIDRAAFFVGLSLVDRAVVSQIIGTEEHPSLILTQVVVNPTKLSVQVAREHQAAMRQFFDEKTNFTTLEGFVAAKALVSALRRNDYRVDAPSLARAIDNQTIDLGDYALQFIDGRGSRYVQIVLMRKDGTVL